MPFDLVVDIGNSRVKWGRCLHDAVMESVSLPQDEEVSWDAQLRRWHLNQGLRWACAGVDPEVADRFTNWANRRGDTILWLDSWERLALPMHVELPERVGMDRLLNAVAGKHRAGDGVSVILIDMGTAVTVDWVDERGVFRGGAIAPGFRLMALALHDHTARLPLLDRFEGSEAPAVPGTSTMDAIRAGVFWSCVGGIEAMRSQIRSRMQEEPRVFLTGGDAVHVAPTLKGNVELWPFMTLEGVRIAAEAIVEAQP